MSRAMDIRHSELTDEYADMSQLERDDCELPWICCPVCFKPVELTQRSGSSTLFDIPPAVAESGTGTSCGSRIPDFTWRCSTESFRPNWNY
jgi:hypothetical protein